MNVIILNPIPFMMLKWRSKKQHPNPCTSLYHLFPLSDIKIEMLKFPLVIMWDIFYYTLEYSILVFIK